MKFAFIGYDYSIDVLLRLIQEGHEAIQIFSFPCDGMFYFNDHMKEFASENKIPFTEERITQSDISKLYDRGCEIVMVCGYPYKVPEVDESKAYGINLHPALLPRVRGMMPVPYIIMEEPQAAGVTLHKLTQEFDCGDILMQKPLICDENTDVETLGSKIGLVSPDMVAECFNNIEELWNKAQKQDDSKASHYSPPDDKTRSLDWNKGVDENLIKGRAFGRYGVLALIENNTGQKQKLVAFQFSGWKEAHDYPCGELLKLAPREILISVKDGFICLKDFQILQ